MIYDIVGRIIMEKRMFLTSGKHLIEWNARGLSSGIYFVKVESGGVFKTQKAVLVK